MCKRCKVVDIRSRAPNARYCYDCSTFISITRSSYDLLKKDNLRLFAENERLTNENLKLIATIGGEHA